MSVVQILPRAEQPAAPPVSDEPVVVATRSPERRAGRPVAADSLPPPEPYTLDRAFHAMLARFTGGLSPAALSLAWLDWSLHLAAAPERRIEIARNVLRNSRRFVEAAAHGTSPEQEPWSVIRPQSRDRRFKEPPWEVAPFNLLAQAFLLGERWWHDAADRCARRVARK